MEFPETCSVLLPHDSGLFPLGRPLLVLAAAYCVGAWGGCDPLWPDWPECRRV
jgi:hypothetical protein